MVSALQAITFCYNEIVMYCDFYGLKEKPFNLTADPEFFFLSRRHEEALAHLIYGVNERKGVIVLTGEVGAGKTTLCRFFLNQLKDNVKTAFILNPSFSGLELLEAILCDFGIKPRSKSRFGFVSELNRYLVSRARAGNNVVLVIDEAQALGAEQLEQVRLLTNLETEKNKLLQIILVGQPELNRILESESLKQLRQRVWVKYHVSGLMHEETYIYIRHRLNVAGANGRVHFSDEAINLIWEASAGIPRLINAISDRALLAGFNARTNIIDAALVRLAAAEIK